MSLDLSSIKNIQDAAVTVMGLGRYKKGSGIGAAKWLMRHGAQIVITDLKDEEDLRESVDEIMRWYSEYRKEMPGKEIYQPVFILGKHDADNFTNVDLVVQNPGVARESEFVEMAKKEKIDVESDISLFFRYCPYPIYSITGTRGKSTTTALLGEMLKHKHPKAVVAGNITRSPLEDLDWLLTEKTEVPIVLELSSWLLESLEGMKLGPQIAILTNAYKDHLDRYDSFEHYMWAKELIFQEQTEDQIAILNADQEIMHEIAGRIPSKHQYWISEKELPEGKEGAFRDGDNLVRRIGGTDTPFGHVHDVKIEGDHNIMNALSASLAAHLGGVSDEDIHTSLKVFAGLPGRQEVLGEHEGVMYVNDTTATSPEGVIAALNRFGKGGNIVLIAGGTSKGLDYEAVGKLIGEQCKYVVLFDGSATDDLEKAIGDAAVTVRAKDMKEAVKLARENSSLGDVILLSPGASSFGMFKNEFDRGGQFEEEFGGAAKKG
ncbi:UDP-N-acetylmuramoyl-L-alanine--D-glutamate ligase [Candidatus Uhrbacteria bacterium]|jgi:UDP-N-acetylmuramoylalanine--D-glutamate ligase|nr:UDP-N-acetylmuramoyl-L-alanine--D-glutamate ligase [Candidatus Uhrbacteria bacterium]